MMLNANIKHTIINADLWSTTISKSSKQLYQLRYMNVITLQGIVILLGIGTLADIIITLPYVLCGCLCS